VSAPIPKKISQILPKFQNVAQTSHYLVKFALPPSSLRSFLRKKGIDPRFHTEDIGLLCSSASLPGSTFATEVVTGEYQGVTEIIPHTRNFTRIKLEFYVDNEYKTLKFLEHWMEYITGGNHAGSPLADAYNFRLHYPEQYRSQFTQIIKFEKNYRQSLEYTFKGLYPLALDSTRVQYQKSNVLKATCSFAYERYICGEASSLSEFNNTNENTVSQSASRYGRKAKNPNAAVINATAGSNNQVLQEITNESPGWRPEINMDFFKTPVDSDTWHLFDPGPGP
tara:strand:+ start:614 stop:1456 length:843 start_codon:yes stop_codon:yes gene_type:complete